MNLTVIEQVVWVLENEISSDCIQIALELQNRQSFRDTYLNPDLLCQFAGDRVSLQIIGYEL